ncbi:MAG: hypothetical protein V3S46_08560 [Nitrospinota bacterium]
MKRLKDYFAGVFGFFLVLMVGILGWWVIIHLLVHDVWSGVMVGIAAVVSMIIVKTMDNHVSKNYSSDGETPLTGEGCITSYLHSVLAYIVMSAILILVGLTAYILIPIAAKATFG